LLVDRFGQLPPDFFDLADSPAAEARRQEGRKRLVEVVQVIGGPCRQQQQPLPGGGGGGEGEKGGVDSSVATA
jgi:hypothetical protein